MSFVRRKIDVKFTLGKGKFGESGADTITLTGLRVQASIVKVGIATMNQAKVLIWGMNSSQMAQLSRVNGVPTTIADNTMEIIVGDDVSGMSTVFIGTIFSAIADFNGMPNVCMSVTAVTGGIEAYRPEQALSYKGSAAVATIMAGIATKMGKVFKNYGVTSVLIDPCFNGTLWEQYKAVVQSANIEAMVDDESLSIWPKGSAKDDIVPLVSKDTGLVGYPRYTAQGIEFRSLYTPNIGFRQKIRIKSSFQDELQRYSSDPLLMNMDGEWTVYRLSFNLESETPGGMWFMDIAATAPMFNNVM